MEARPKADGSARHYMYLNLKGFSLPHGLGVGGSIDAGFRLFLPESLEGCVAGAADGTFGYGPLAGSKHFELEALEVCGWVVGWIGVGGPTTTPTSHDTARDIY